MIDPMFWHAVIYRCRSGHRKSWRWYCSCGRSEHAGNEGAAYRRAALHIARSRVS